jgi:DNA-binding NtrC family response regulator
MSKSAEGGFIMNEKNGLVFIVDDDRHTRESLSNLIRSAGLSAQTFSSAQEFLAVERPKRPSCLVLDVHLPGLSGLDLQQELAKAGVKIPIIFITGHGDIPTSVRAIKAGALEFLTKPLNREDLLRAIHQAIARDDIARQPNGATGTHNFDEIIGESPALKRTLKQVEIVAPTDSAVLLLGETGTGKELIARAIHNLSFRREQTLVKVNCAAIPTGLLESELFGHEKGAFTGAIAQRIGRFELADGGTVFLDEVGEIPLELQPKLLRVLQEREFERLGSTRTLRTDARLIAATNRDLRQMVEQRQFREDLFYRLNVFPIYVPALRERSEDIPLLVNHFAQRFARRMNRTIETIPAETMVALTRYPWPGNIRELQNLIERAVILSRGPVLQIPLQDLDNRTTPRRDNSNDQTLEAAERTHILAILKETRWVLGGARGAAARLGINRSTLQFRLNKLGIVRPDICASLD